MKHEIVAMEQDFLEDGEVAVCSCGWKSERGALRQIRAWHANHKAEMENEAAKAPVAS